MPEVSSQTVAEYLKRMGWEHRVLDNRRIITGIRCTVPFYDYGALIEIHVGQHWVSVRAFLHTHVAAARRGAMLRFIAALNAHYHEVRFLLVEDCVLVQREIPSVQCHFESFVDALRAVGRDATWSGLEIAMLATNASVSKLFEEVDDAMVPRTAAAHGDGSQADFELAINRVTD